MAPVHRLVTGGFHNEVQFAGLLYREEGCGLSFADFNLPLSLLRIAHLDCEFAGKAAVRRTNLLVPLLRAVLVLL